MYKKIIVCMTLFILSKNKKYSKRFTLQNQNIYAKNMII